MTTFWTYLEFAVMVGGIPLGVFLGYRLANANLVVNHLAKPGDCALCARGIRHDKHWGRV